MASKKPKAAPTDEELLAQFDDLTEENEAPKKAAKPGPGKPRAPPAAQQQEEAELFTELENLTQERPKSRPQTPSGGAGSTSQATGKRLSTTTPPPGAPRSSEERPTVQSRKSGEGTRSFHQGMTPAEEKAPEQEEDPAEQSSGGGWWGGFMATASAAVKQAEAIAKEIQKNEEAQRWAEQVRGNVGALRNYGQCLNLDI